MFRTLILAISLVLFGVHRMVAEEDAAAPDAGRPSGYTLELSNGVRLHGTPEAGVGDVVRWQLAGQEVELPFDTIRLIEDHDRGSTWIPDMGIEALLDDAATPTDDEAGADAETADDEVEPAPTYASLPLLDPQVVFRRTYDLTRRIELGGRFVDGNSNSDSLNVLGEFGRRTDRIDEEFEFGGIVSSADGELISNQWWANGTVDFNRADDAKWLFFITSRNEYDQFENLDYRGTLSAGLGYRFYKEQNCELTVRVGPGVTGEFFRNPYRDEITPDLFGQLEWKQPLGDRLVYENNTTINPTVEDFRIFRVVNRNGLLLPLDEEKQWNLKLGVRIDYNSFPNPGKDPTDYTTSLLLVYKRNN